MADAPVFVPATVSGSGEERADSVERGEPDPTQRGVLPIEEIDEVQFAAPVGIMQVDTGTVSDPDRPAVRGPDTEQQVQALYEPAAPAGFRQVGADLGKVAHPAFDGVDVAVQPLG
jgi:hypothetical protein